uniref:Fe2OG dioxygenase domain-containing protein n=1 Tax=Skeletonema marinoi TaxID=267567 RepID=A0A7S2KTB1_9STRA
MLRYEPGQFYNQHHDYIEYQQDLPCGVRMLTLFLYLNDVEEGGGTSFPLVNNKKGIVVQPKRGNALLWPSVLDEDPEEKDGRTDHEALPVLKGIKYGANAWIHSRNYTQAEEDDCT